VTRLSVRLALLLICLAAMGSAAYLVWISEQHARADDAAARRFTDAARGAAVTVADLRGAQQAYVAAGQGNDYWFARVASLATDLRGTLSILKSLTTSAAALQALDEAGGALQDFEQMDGRAREYVRTRQLTQASDLIFADGFDLTRKAADAVARALTAERSDRDDVLGFLKRREIYSLAGSAGVAALGLLLLVGRAGPRPDEVAAAVAAPPTRSSSPVPRHVSADVDDFRAIERRPVAPSPPPAAAVPAPGPAIKFDGVASLCADLAKVSDTRALPALLERAAAILDASAIVVWIADPDKRELAAILVHGYPPQLANRLGTIARDAENVTASAFRTGLLQTVKGDAASNGAVAAPLVAVGGCVGVMAAEMRHGGEQQPPMLSAATIIAAQLATLVGPPSVRATNTAAG